MFRQSIAEISDGFSAVHGRESRAEVLVKLVQRQ
jgi:hypothetical protein